MGVHRAQHGTELFTVVLSVGHPRFNMDCETGLQELIDRMSDTEDADYDPYDRVLRWARKVVDWVEERIPHALCNARFEAWRRDEEGTPLAGKPEHPRRREQPLQGCN